MTEKEGKKKIGGFRKFMLYFIGFMVVMIIVIGALANSGDNPKPAVTPKQTKAKAEVAKESVKIEAYVMSQEFVSRRLKSPATAKYPYSSEISITDMGEGNFDITAYVDSENSFGANIRTHYYAKVKQVDKDNWELVDLQVFE